MTPSDSAALGLPARRTPLNTPRKSETPRTTAYTDPPGELVLGARHAGMYTAAQGGLSAVSVAHTWHAVMDGHPTAVAGEEGIVTLHVGQPSKACVVSVEIEPTSKRAKQRHAEENLKRDYDLAHPSLRKGEHVRLVFGPCMAAGPHLLSVTLNGAHVAGSPYTLAVRPAAASALSSEVRGAGAEKPGSGAPRNAVYAVAGEAFTFGVGLLDRFGNRLLDADARAVAESSEHAEVSGVSRAPEAVAAAGGLSLVSWLAEPPSLERLPPPRDRTAAGGDTPQKDGDGDDEYGNYVYDDGADGGLEALDQRLLEPASFGPPAPPYEVDGAGPRGVVRVTTRRREPGIHEGSLALGGRPLRERVRIHVSPAKPVASTSTAHGRSARRTVAGMPSELLLVARDQFGNAAPAGADRWGVALAPSLPGHGDGHHAGTYGEVVEGGGAGGGFDELHAVALADGTRSFGTILALRGRMPYTSASARRGGGRRRSRSAALRSSSR